MNQGGERERTVGGEMGVSAVEEQEEREGEGERHKAGEEESG